VIFVSPLHATVFYGIGLSVLALLVASVVVDNRPGLVRFSRIMGLQAYLPTRLTGAHQHNPPFTPGPLHIREDRMNVSLESRDGEKIATLHACSKGRMLGNATLFASAEELLQAGQDQLAIMQRIASGEPFSPEEAAGWAIVLQNITGKFQEVKS
jgi:hypothetical protein